MNIYLPLYFLVSLGDPRCKAILASMRKHSKAKFALIGNLLSAMV